MIIEDLSLMASTNNETFQFLCLLFGVLLPDLQVINLTPVTIKPPIDLFKIPPHHFGSCLHWRDQFLDLQRESSELSSICLRLGVELAKILIPGVQTNVHQLLNLQRSLIWVSKQSAYQEDVRR